MKPYIVLGLGKTGLSCVRFLTAQGLPVVVNDSRQFPPALEQLMAEYPEVEVVLGGFDARRIADTSEVVISPGINLQEVALQGVSPIGDIELFARAAKAPIIAITGSNGKSTVTQLVYEMAIQAGFSAEVGGNIGVPALDLLAKPVPDLYVLELSSFQLEVTHSLKAKAAVVLNLSPDHLDRHGDMRSYAQAKQRIYSGCDHEIINLDHPESYQNAVDKAAPNVIGFGLVQGDFYCTPDQQDFVFNGQKLMPISQMYLKGEHNVQNALAALALGHAAGFSLEAMCQTLREFQGLPHRCQWVACLNQVNFFNDSKGTNIAATLVGIACIAQQTKGKIILIAGGQTKESDFSALLPALEKHVRAVILMGRDRALLDSAFKKVTRTQLVDSMQAAVELAQQIAQPHDAVLLSPACASFDMFNNFEHRGQVFVEAASKK